MKKLLSLFIALTALAFAAGPAYAYTFPSTNDNNRSLGGRPFVNQVDVGVGYITLNFINEHTNSLAYFEYRIDGQAKTSGTAHPVVTGDFIYPGVSVDTRPAGGGSLTIPRTISASSYIEIRLALGGERDWDFDWTRFDVIPKITTPTITGFINPTLGCGALTNIHSTTVDWTDSTGGTGGITYEYKVDYPLIGGGLGSWTTTLTPSQRTGSLNEGIHYVKVRAKDSAGNYSEWSNVCSLTSDWTAPDVEITTPTDGSTISGTVEVKGSVTDVNPHHYWFVIQNSGGVTVAGPGTVNDATSFTDKSLLSWNTTLVSDGVYKIKFEARDAANNKDAGSVDWHTVTVDNDSDDDGAPNPTDNCPTVPNQDQTDTDSDGQGDACDDDIDGDEVVNELDCAPANSEVFVLVDTKACQLYQSGISGEGILTAPGLQKPFNENSNAAENAGKKK